MARQLILAKDLFREMDAMQAIRPGVRRLRLHNNFEWIGERLWNGKRSRFPVPRST